MTEEMVAELRQSEQALTKDTRELAEEWEKPLLVDADGHIQQGVYWIHGEFTTRFWEKPSRKPKPVKCLCACCGNTHNRKGV